MAPWSLTPSLGATTVTEIPWKWAYVSTTRMTASVSVPESTTRLRFFAEATIMNIASAVAVAPSYMEALVASIPVSSLIMLWYSNMYWSVPCEISG